MGLKQISSPDSEKAPLCQVSAVGERLLVVPEVNSVVTCKVASVNPRMAKVAIVCVDQIPVKEHFRGIIRVQDVRATEKDKVEIYKSFRPGDIVQARVISLGDSRSYFLSTAENELGVVAATSAAGHALIPISWSEMQCQGSGIVEQRKVAKVDADLISTTTATTATNSA